MKPFHRKIFLLFALIVFGCKNDDQDTSNCNFVNFYYYKDQKLSLGNMSSQYLLIGSDTSNTDDEIKNFIKARNFFDQTYDFKIIKGPPSKYMLIPVKLNEISNCSEIARIIGDIKKNSLVDFAHYTFQTDDCISPIFEPMGRKCVDSYGNFIYVKVKDTTDISALDSIMKVTNTSDKKQDQFQKSFFSITVDKNAKGDAMEMAKYFYETGLFESAEPAILKFAVE
jgi:hypothetical protein